MILGFVINEIIAVGMFRVNDYLPGCGETFSWPLKFYGCGNNLVLGNFGNYLFWILISFIILLTIRHFRKKKQNLSNQI